MKALKLRQTIVFTLTGILAAALLLSGCGKKAEPQATATEPASSSAAALQVSGLLILHETEFGGVYLDPTIEEFNEMGFEYGDSIDIQFSNGYLLEDIPYYNGFYTKIGMPLLVAYPGYPHIRAGFNNGEDLWVVADLKEDDTADVTLHERAKYLSIQEARDIHYSDDREKFPSDQVFANFRPLSGGKLRANTFYRSASPADNQHNRAPYVDALMAQEGVQYIVDLADNEQKISGYMEDPKFDSPYFQFLYENGNVIPLALTANYASEDFRQKTALGCTAMMEHSGPYLIHCTEGKDRTGFVCLLLEALAGASYEEILSDYMITYDNYYQINETQQADKYHTIIEEVLNPMIEIIAPDADIKTADLSPYAKGYLASGGMTEEEIAQFTDFITQ